MVADLPLVVRRLAAAGKQVILNTNGELLSRDCARALGIGVSIQVVGVSIDGGQASVHRRMRGPRADLRKCIDAATIARSCGTRLKVASVFSSVNLDGIPQLARLVDALAPDVWRIYQYTQRGVGASRSSHYELEAEGFGNALRLAKRLCPTVPIRSSTSDQMDGCFIVSHTGHVLQPKGLSYSNLGSCLHKPIDAIWHDRWTRRLETTLNKKWIGLTVRQT